MYDIIDYLINIIIGLIIGIILGYVLFKKIEYHGLDSNDVVKEIHIDEDGRNSGEFERSAPNHTIENIPK